jgi:nucleoside-diphosphate-sugar epimerase
LKILITGAGGFLGQYLAQELADDYEVHAFTRQQLNLADASAVQQHFTFAKYDSVIHCGAAGRNTPMVEDWNIVSNNLASVLNLMTNQKSFGQLINIGTGAEFDVSLPVDCVSEAEIFNRDPRQSYGLSKNIIARYLSEQANCFTLRLFGCFDSQEDDRRLLKKFHSVVSTGARFSIQDRDFDMISARDFTTIVRAVLNKQVTDQNINCVYAKKYRLSEILSVYCDKHGLDSSLIDVSGQGLNYTGNGDTLSKYHLDLEGLEQALANYEIKNQ